MTDGPLARTVKCVGCGGLVPDEDGPVHRYMTASPGCWRVYSELSAGGMPPSPRAALAVDAYAVTHPGVPGQQATPSVWIHLVTLCFTLERGWPAERAVRLRRVGADAFDGWPWLQPPDSMGEITAMDVAMEPDPTAAGRLVDRWIDGAWAAWSGSHPAIRSRADALAALLR
jgi:hypothetical protein